MYLSRVRLRPDILRSTQLSQLVHQNPYGNHQLLWDLFPGTDGKPRDFLYREESGRGSAGNQSHYYLLSPQPPSIDSPLFEVDYKVFEPILNEGDLLSFRLRVNPVVSRRQEGKKNSTHHDVVMDAQYQTLHFLCQGANILAAGKSKQVLNRELSSLNFDDLRPLIEEHWPEHIGCDSLQALLWDRTEQAKINWLLKRADQHGFAVESNGNGDYRLQADGYDWHALPRKGRQAGFSTLDYEGVLKVADPDRFRSMLCSGLGKARAFGCGLMMIRRL